MKGEIDPGSTWKPLPEAGGQGHYDKVQLIVHSTGTMASAENNYRYFKNENIGVESTFVVGLTPSDPTLQIMPANARADANGQANRRAISIEVVGDGYGPYTAWQESEIKRIARWAMEHHDIPARIIRWESDPGFGWHVMLGAPGPWTSVNGKECPGKARIARLKSHIFPAIFSGGSATQQQEEISMSAESNIIKEIGFAHTRNMEVTGRLAIETKANAEKLDVLSKAVLAVDADGDARSARIETAMRALARVDSNSAAQRADLDRRLAAEAEAAKA